MNKHWSNEAIFYHIYPLGFCGAPEKNDFTTPPLARLDKIYSWIEHLKQLGINALYLGPLFESGEHGYDTADYFTVDRRLGTNETLAKLVKVLHENGIRVILDGVFHHVGRDFWAFRDVLKHGENSRYRDWFTGLTFEGSSPYGDPFQYEAWHGHYSLVKLNLHNQEVREHIFQAVQDWISKFEIDGLRLDVAEDIDISFLKALASFCHEINPDFWLMGEVIHGDYRQWANAETLDSTTNYECYKGLYSSHVDANYFEIAHSLKRLFDDPGIYKHLSLYNFADNHDVDRVASTLNDSRHLYPLYTLLFTIPGIPSIYYGSEWGWKGKKADGDDSILRPDIDLRRAPQESPHPDLAKTIASLAKIRKSSSALQYGNYQQLFVAHEQFAFVRQSNDEYVVVLVNASGEETSVDLKIPTQKGRTLVDLLNPEESFAIHPQTTKVTVHPHWGRIMKVV
ncbi:alpha-amylase family glycosyl hydrolase [Catalinimonas niigatensis]|uniref:alpha-amylase family glycosyl hydrolase n=1 Tax=Catalinimonas niigatensis TaxID=1397264 RepID=UPI002666F1B9|nr:alpha-amylase family glycosyl hydrolase [Catalinimonas niigatensis]WPP49225.1 alpha-amylase family glycosyl hydrolase [Catalinimonas niigatensis]